VRFAQLPIARDRIYLGLKEAGLVPAREQVLS
jgi:hypothetical protein